MMRHNKYIHWIAIITVLSICSCGELKIKGDIDGLGEVADSLESDDSNTSTDTVSEETENDSETSHDDSSASSDTSGGVDYLPSSEKGTNRYFMGTWSVVDYYTDCADEGYDLPSTLRLYSHAAYIDFETSKSELVWQAGLYPDDTFDFEIGYLDIFGDPSIELVCTCSITDNNDYWADTMDCTCDPSNNSDSCGLYYEKMNN